MPNSRSKSVILDASIPHIDAKSCKEITHSSKSNFLLSFSALSHAKKTALIKMYAFFRIADDCVDELESPHEKQTALDFWKTELKKIYKKKKSHPVMEEIREVVEAYKIPQDYLTGLIKGCEMDIVKTRYKTFKELHEYCYHVAGLVGLTCLKIFEYKSPTAENMAVDLGLAFQLTNIIRDIKGDLELGRIYIPQNDMKKFGYSEDDLINNIENDAFYDLMNHYADKTENYYQSAFHEFHKTKSKNLAAAKIMAKVYYKIFQKIQHENFPVLRKKISLNVWEKLTSANPFSSELGHD